MKNPWKVIAASVAIFILLWAGCKAASNQRFVNGLNPVWEVQGHVLSEEGRPMSDVHLDVGYGIGYYEIGRILEQGATFESETVRPDTNGFFSIRKQCSCMIIRSADSRYEIAAPRGQNAEVQFCKFLSAWPDSLIHNTSDKNLKIVLRERAPTDTQSNPQGGANGSQPIRSETNRTSAAAASRRSP